MNDRFYTKTITTAIDTYGEHAQQLMAIEEMSELTKAICKYFRAEKNTEQEGRAIAQILEEMADVEIMLDQLKIMFGNPEDEKELKIHRLFHRLRG